MSRISEVFDRLYAEAIYSSSASATKRDMNDDLELIEAELYRLQAEAELMEAVCEAAERWSREDETPNIARNEHALVCATAALDAYRRERGIA